MTNPIPHDTYDPELHGVPEQTAPAAQRGMAIALTLIIFAIPFLAWTMLT